MMQELPWKVDMQMDKESGCIYGTNQPSIVQTVISNRP
jgi:hypothetical protein